MSLEEALYLALPFAGLTSLLCNSVVLKAARNIDLPFRYILYLAISDIALGLSTTITGIHGFILTTMIPSNEMIPPLHCLLLGPDSIFWVFVSTLQQLVTVSMAADRLFNIIMPLFYRKVSSKILSQVIFSTLVICSITGTIWIFILAMQIPRVSIPIVCNAADVLGAEYYDIYLAFQYYASALGLVLTTATLLICALRYTTHKWSYIISKSCDSIMPLNTVSTLRCILLSFSVLPTDKVLTFLCFYVSIKPETQMLVSRTLFLLLISAFHTTIVFILVPSLRRNIGISCQKYRAEENIVMNANGERKIDQQSLSMWSTNENHYRQLDPESLEVRADRERSISFYMTIRPSNEDERLQRMKDAKETRDIEKRERREKRRIDRELGETTVIMFDAYSAGEVGLKLPFEITSISCLKSSQSVYAGSRLGHLCVYAQAKNSRRGYEMNGLCKNFERKAVLNMVMLEKEQLLLCVSDGVLAAHNLADAQYPVISPLLKVRPVHTFIAWVPKDKRNLRVLISSKKRLYIFKWFDRDFHELRFDYNQSFADNPTNLRLCGEVIAFSVRDEYFVMTLTETGFSPEAAGYTGDVRRLFATSDIPVVVSIYDKGLIGFTRSETLVICKPDGTKSPQCTDIKFSDTPQSLVYDSPYMVALLTKGRIEVRSVSPSILVQSIALNKAQFLCQGNPGNVYVASTASMSDVWILDVAPNLRKNVSTLINERHFDLAIQIAEGSNIFTDENKVEIKRQAALNLFNQRKFEESFALHKEIKSEVISIIQLFPELLPERLQKPSAIVDFPANDKKRALLALCNYLSAVRFDYAQQLDQNQRTKTGQPPLSKEALQNLHFALQIVDTTLLQCYLKTKPMLVDSLLRLHNNTCFFEDAQSILKKENRLSSLFILYESRKKHEMALELLQQQSQKHDADVFFEGTERTVEYLQFLGNTHLELIFRYAKWVLAKDLSQGLAIFIGDESDIARSLDRDKVLDYLRSQCVLAVIPYLEHLIYKWEETRPHFHEALVEHYVNKVKILMQDYVHAFPDDENLTRAGEEEGDLGLYRRSLIRFLQYSLLYSPQAILLQLSHYPFYEERALILGRLKQHEQALTIYTSILNDFDAAEQYCQLYFDKNDEVNSQVYIQWLRAYVCPSDPVIAGLSEQELPIPSPDVHNAIKVLSRHADRIDTVVALGLLPADTPLRTLSKALNAVLQTVHDDATACSLRSSVCEAAVERAELRLKQAESTRIVVANSSECIKCGKKIGNSAFVRFPADGTLAHFGCSGKE